MGRKPFPPRWMKRAMCKHMESVAAGETNINHEQMTDLLCSTFPHIYSPRHREALIKSVSRCWRNPSNQRLTRNTPLPNVSACTKPINKRLTRNTPLPKTDDVIVIDVDEVSQVMKKRRTRYKTRDVNGEIEVFSSSAPSSSSDSDGDRSESYKVAYGGREKDEGGDDGRADVNGINLPISRGLEGSGELGEARGETSGNGDGGRADVNGVKRPIPRSGELGEGRRETDGNGDGGRAAAKGFKRSISKDLEGTDELGDGPIRDVSGNNRPLFRDLRGMDRVLQELRREVIVPLRQLKLMRHLGVEPMARILFHGPPGCGKTTLARAVANEAGVSFYEISAAGAPKEKIRELFSTAYARAPCILFIDEIDAMTSITDSLQKETQPVAVNQLINCMDEPYNLTKPVNNDSGYENSNGRPGYVLVIGATNKPDAVDPALRKLFDREIVIGAPNESARFNILSVLTRNLKVEAGFDCAKIARCAVGFVGGDLVALVRKAGIHAVNRIVDMKNSELSNEQEVGVQCEDNCSQPLHDEEMENLSITMGDFVEAGKMVQPSTEIEGFSTTPNAKWDDVGGLRLLKSEFECHIVNPIKFPKVYKDLGVNLKTKFFLYGPAGCGKTFAVEALANEAGANLMHIKVPELLKYGDQSGLVVKIIFNYASTHSPCIIFFDELDVITPYEGQWPDFRQLVELLSDAEHMRGVYVIGATNRKEIVSHFEKFIRPQFDKILYVSRPSPEERGLILKALARNKPIDANVDLMALGKDVSCENLNGADLSALMKEAVKAAIDNPTSSGGGGSLPWTIKDVDFKNALKKIYPYVWSKKVKNC